MRSETRTNKKNARLILSGIIAAIILLGIICTYTAFIYNKGKSWEGLIYPGVKVGNLDLSGKTKDEAKALLKTSFGDVVLKKKVNITTDKNTYSIDYSKLNARYNIDEVVDEAFSYGKNLGMFKKYEIIKNPVEKSYSLKFSYDNNPVKEVIAAMEKDINKEPVNASIEMVSSGSFKVTPDTKGYKLQSGNLEKEITDKINGEISEDINIKAPIEELTAVITGDKLSSIDTKVSTFNTNFSTSSNERAYNIELATKSINGKILMPGDTFSFNDIVGERTKNRGFREAPVIVGNKVESGLGGGICQVSSTLYNAILRASLKGTERTHHTLPSSYVPLGQDATVDWGNIDFKFQNTLDYPIYIEGYTQNRNLYFNLYSNSSLTKKTFSISNEVYETINSTVKTIDDPNLPEGQIVKEQQPYTGFKVKVIRNTYENGALVNSEVISNDFYKPVTGIIRRGTKVK